VPTLPPPSAPASISASATSTTNIDVSWSSVSGASRYQLQRSPNWQTVSGNISGTSRSVGGLSHSTTYSFRVRAHGDGITKAGWGSFSSEASATTYTPVPVPTLAPPPAPNVSNNLYTGPSTYPGAAACAQRQQHLCHHFQHQCFVGQAHRSCDAQVWHLHR
jgi:hypothetical protein